MCSGCEGQILKTARKGHGQCVSQRVGDSTCIEMVPSARTPEVLLLSGGQILPCYGRENPGSESREDLPKVISRKGTRIQPPSVSSS